MASIHYVTDTQGNPIYVQLPVEEYERLLAAAEELEDIEAYKKAKNKAGKVVPFDQAFQQVEEYHRERVP